ncbi:MAG: hypothetical protein AAB354_07225 [candidate division KSB1 bacterium]
MMIASIKKHPFHWALLASLLFHVCAYFFTGLGLNFLRVLQLLPEAVASAPEEQPKPPLVFEVVETPNSARRTETPDNAKHASDKSAVAQNPAAPQDLPLGAAYTQGELAEAEASTRSASSSQAEAKAERKEQHPQPAQNYNFTSQPFRREYLTGQQAPSAQSSATQLALRDQRNSRAPQLGSFSLDTYEWNFAPYMLWLKKRVQSNIYPPPAFTHMGLISGQTFLRFKIYRDGSLRDLELIDYRGHKTLMQTSMRAIELSVPLQKLPPDFPKDYLEVTAQFDYTLLHSRNADEP